MTTKKEEFVGEPEVTATSVQKKGDRRPAAKGRAIKVTHTNKKADGKTWLRTYIGMVIVVDAIVGLTMIHGYLDSPEEVRLQAHTMWLYGLTHAMAAGALLFHKLE